jgi:hypothetical protein
MFSDACPVCSLSHAKYKIFNSFILFDTDLMSSQTPMVSLPIIQQPVMSINLKKTRSAEMWRMPDNRFLKL